MRIVDASGPLVPARMYQQPGALGKAQILENIGGAMPRCSFSCPTSLGTALFSFLISASAWKHCDFL